MNKITVYGRLTADIEVKTTQNGKSIASLKIASNGRNKDETNFFDAKAFGGLADTMSKYLHKGDPIVAYGNMHQYEYDKQDGTKYRGWELLIEEIDFIPTGAKKQPTEQEPTIEIQTSKLPF